MGVKGTAVGVDAATRVGTGMLDAGAGVGGSAGAGDGATVAAAIASAVGDVSAGWAPPSPQAAISKTAVAAAVARDFM